MAFLRPGLKRAFSAMLFLGVEFLGLRPISVNLRSLGLYVEDLSRRDSVKVAQYEVLGNDAKRHVRPARDDRKRSAFDLARRSAIASNRSIVPSGTDTSFKNANPVRQLPDTGLLS
jgi:hypothetical protein